MQCALLTFESKASKSFGFLLVFLGLELFNCQHELFVLLQLLLSRLLLFCLLLVKLLESWKMLPARPLKQPLRSSWDQSS